MMLSDTECSSHGSYHPFLSLFSGLNLGMCDAIALAKTISVHIKTQDPQLLLNYSSNRRARAIRVVEISRSAMSTLVRLMNSTLLRRWLVKHILDRVGFLKYQVIWQLSGLGAKQDSCQIA